MDIPKRDTDITDVASYIREYWLAPILDHKHAYKSETNRRAELVL